MNAGSENSASGSKDLIPLWFQVHLGVWGGGGITWIGSLSRVMLWEACR
jgi:Na+/H+ antiporter NhaD/arsenite permease-like protein